MDLLNRKILLGITGGVAAYKACELARRLQDEGAQVQAILTHGALHFVTPMMLQALTGRPAYVELWDERLDQAMGHIVLSRDADALVVRELFCEPATRPGRAVVDHRDDGVRVA